MSPAELSRRLAAVLPHGPPRSLRLLAEGDHCRAFLVDGGLVARVARHAAADAGLRREACVLPALADTLGVRVPRPRYVPGRRPDEPGLSLHEHLPGVPLTRERWAGRRLGIRRTLARQVGRFLRELHDVGTGAASGCELEELDHAARARELDRRLRGPEGAALTPDLLLPLRRALERLALAAGEGASRPTILHADVSPEHVLVEGETARLAAVLDWGDVCLGDPARDFIFLLEDWGADFLGLALEVYRPTEPQRFRHRVRLHQLAEGLAWTMDAARAGRDADAREGLGGLARGLEGLARAERP